MSQGFEAQGNQEKLLDKAATDLLVSSFNHHKSHARFQETQRSAFLGAYIALTGLVSAPLLAKALSTEGMTDTLISLAVMCLGFLIFLGILVGLAVTKVGVEFKRHFHQGEKILVTVSRSTQVSPEVRRAFTEAMLGTVSDEEIGLSRFVARNLSVAAIHNYMISLILASEATMLFAILGARPEILIGIFCGSAIILSIFFDFYRIIITRRLKIHNRTTD